MQAVNGQIVNLGSRDLVIHIDEQEVLRVARDRLIVSDRVAIDEVGRAFIQAVNELWGRA